jgi:plastocyanin
LRRLAIIGAGLSLVTGCGGDDRAVDNTTSSSTRSATPRRIVVEETEYRMTPSIGRVPLGTYVFRGVNKGKLPHVLEVEGPGSENETGTIPPGGTSDLELVLRTPGKYELYCPLDQHKKKGMVATLMVKPG